ncbi:hypothetical protein, partial [Ralstonia solanacearum]
LPQSEKPRWHDSRFHSPTSLISGSLVKRCDLEDNSDPERLALLDMETAERLRTKYGQALKLLDDA